jgi:cation diffusion facilitator CzcD-associated flavoprotein CzcO
VQKTEVVIVGAGFAGLGMAIRLQQEGIDDFVLLERASGVGGVWRDNRYPGLTCDIESHLYSYSFEPNPNWTRMFAPQPEILAYLERCADKYGLRSRIRFDTPATGATFDEQSGRWTVETGGREPVSARVLISGAGHALSQPVYPEIPGRTAFAGKTMHSARWDASLALEGKTVAVIGTGASAIQIVPSIAPRVRQLHVFQRSPPWILPKPDRDIAARERKRFERFPLLQRLWRWWQFWVHELSGAGFFVTFSVMAFGQWLARRYLGTAVPDPALRARLTPAYKMGCKRILVSSDYYPALLRPNVELVTERIQEIRPHSLVTADGRERPVDVLVFATGFEAAEAKPPFGVRGRGGLELVEAWRDGIEAYLGTAISGFPNLFLLVGPNTGLGHSSMVLMMESQIRYILDAVRALRSRGLKFVDVLRDVQRRYNVSIQKRLARTVWNTGGCLSWYRTRSGKNTTLWPGFTAEFRWRTRRFDASNYEQIR